MLSGCSMYFDWLKVWKASAPEKRLQINLQNSVNGLGFRMYYCNGSMNTIISLGSFSFLLQDFVALGLGQSYYNLNNLDIVTCTRDGKLNTFAMSKGFVIELVSKELNHFGVIAGLFRQIGGHSSRFVLFCSF